MNVTIESLEARHWTEVREIYLQGIRTRNATFEESAGDWSAWDAAHMPEGRLVAIEDGRVVGWAALATVSRRPAYRGVAEVSVYVAADRQGRGAGRALLERLIAASESAGVWTLQAGIFPENGPSLELHRRLGFREVGRRERIGRLDGVWRDVILLERRSASVGV